MNHEWLYVSNLSPMIWDKMTPEEKIEFPFDMKLIDWKACLDGYNYGI
jgi:hypothetical protein